MTSWEPGCLSLGSDADFYARSLIGGAEPMRGAIEMRGVAGALCIPMAVLWCAWSASLFFVAALDADDRRWLLAYPVALFYTCFALISIF